MINIITKEEEMEEEEEKEEYKGRTDINNLNGLDATVRVATLPL